LRMALCGERDSKPQVLVSGTKVAQSLMDEQTIKDFWQRHPYGDAQVGGLRSRFDSDYDRFFTDYDHFQYRNERHLPTCVAALNLAGKEVLEIGLSEGAESELMIRHGARWSGADLAAESVERVLTRLTVRELPALLATYPLAWAGILRRDPSRGTLAGHLANAKDQEPRTSPLLAARGVHSPQHRRARQPV
jgi:hypothetical protein